MAPGSFVDTNVRGTLHVLEGAREAGCRRVIHTSTSEVYGTPDSIPIREDHPLQGQSPYSATKIAADKLCEAYARSFETPVIVLRPFNTYGPRQSARAVLPTILTQLMAKKRQIRLGEVIALRLDPPAVTWLAEAPGVLRCVEADGWVECTVDEAEKRLPELLRALHNDGVVIRNVQVREPELEEVFVELAK